MDDQKQTYIYFGLILIHCSLHSSMHFVVKQLQLLWSPKMIRLLFSELLSYVEADMERTNVKQPSPSKSKAPDTFLSLRPEFRCRHRVIILSVCSSTSVFVLTLLQHDNSNSFQFRDFILHAQKGG